MLSRTGGHGLLAQVVACSLLFFTVFVAPAAAMPRDFSWLVKRQSSTLKTELGPLLATGIAAIIEPSDAQFINAKSRWSEYGAPGVSAVINATSEQDIVRAVSYLHLHFNQDYQLISK